MAEKSVKQLQEELKKIQLENKIKALQPVVKEKVSKIKEDKKDADSKIKKEIEELNNQKKNLKGVGGFFQKLSINRQINEKANYIRDKQRVENTKVKAELIKNQVEIAKSQITLKELRKKNMISFDDLYGSGNGIKV